MEPQIPKDKRHLRACLLCSLIKNYSQFKRDGCDNCESVLHTRSSMSRLDDCTTTAFEGSIAAMNPTRSWVAKWQRIRDCVPGLYAIKVNSRLPEDIVDELHRLGIDYRPNDRASIDLDT